MCLFKLSRLLIIVIQAVLIIVVLAELIIEHNGIASYALPAYPPKYLLVSGLVYLYSLHCL